jgi:hypothetical protein
MKMKNITKSLLILLSIFAISCETDDVEDRPVATAVDAPVLAAPGEGSNYVLDVTNAASQIERFVWSSANFDQDVVVNYEVQLDKAGNNFAAPKVIASAAGQNQSAVTVQTLNGAAIAAGGEPFEAAQFEIRIKASLNNASEAMYSNVVTVSITPYTTYPYEDLYLTGTATAAGAENTAANMYPLFRDPANGDSYSYTGYFAPGQFKLVRKKGQSAPSYGTNGTSLVARLTEADADPAAFEVTTAGYYTLTVNVSELTYTFVPFDASAAPTYPTIGVIGSSTPGGWDNDTDMTQSTFDSHIWYINNIALTLNGALKFRANNSWDTNWGGPTSYSGVGVPGGSDIPVGISLNGNYNILFSDITGQYIYIPVN